MSHRQLRAATLVLTLSALAAVPFAPALAAADAAADAAHAAEEAPATTTPAPASIWAGLEGLEGLEERSGAIWWKAAEGPGLGLAGSDPATHAPLLDTASGPLRVDAALLHGAGDELFAALPQLLAAAASEHLETATLELRRGIMTGPQLRGPDLVVLAEGVLRKQVLPPQDHAPVMARLAAAQQALVATLARSGLGDLAQKSIADVLGHLPSDAPDRDGEELDPSFARRLVRGGWLRTVLPDGPEIVALEQAVRAAETFLPMQEFRGPDSRLAEVRDAFGRGGWILTTPRRSACVHPHDHMRLYEAPELQLVVELPAGSDPLAAAEGAEHAALYWGSRRLADWRTGVTGPGQGFHADEDAWRAAIPDHGPGITPAVVSDFVPPHILITQFNGDPVRLVGAHGALTPSRPADTADAARFVAEAARVLPSPAELDLIGEHFFTYVFDSPDPAHPLLVGNATNMGDIHQTSAQTCAATTCGMFRGDCDDLAELYRDIAAAQGRIAYVIHLPGHAAAAFAEKQEDEQWHSFVLQTGQPLEFAAADLPHSLEQLYKHFEPNQTFDPTRVRLALRFEGENTRSTWVLSWRIFAERAYAETMIEVERDWYFHTHHRGIATVQALIAGGDADSANYGELSGLYRRTGEWDQAVDYKRRCLEHISDPATQLLYRVEIISLLARAEHWDEAGAAARALLDGELAASKGAKEDAQLRLATTLAGALDDEHHRALRHELIAKLLFPALAKQTTGVRQWLDARFDQKEWDRNPWIAQYRGLSGGLVGDVLGMLLSEHGPELLAGDGDLRSWTAFAQEWIDSIGFVPNGGEPGGFLAAYATSAALDEAVLGRDALRAMAQAAPFPTSLEHDHRHRLPGLAQLPSDLPWIRLSVPYWTHAVSSEMWRQKSEAFAAERVVRLRAPLLAAVAQCRALGLDSTQGERAVRHAELLIALAGHDAARLRTLFTEVGTLGDRATSEATAELIGSAAKYLDAPWFATVLGIWREVLDQKPLYFAIAWNAAVAHADANALAAARLAAARFPDDAAFAEELAYLEAVVKARAPASGAKAAAPAGGSSGAP